MKSKILFIISVLFGLLFINSGLNKFFNYMPLPKDMSPEMLELFNAFTTIGWLMPLIAIVEIIAGILVMFKPTRALGAIMLFPILVGILLLHLLNEPSGLLMAIVFFALDIWFLFESRNKLKPLFNK